MAAPVTAADEISNKIDLFHNLIDDVLSHWSALQLAINHGMGGQDGEAKGKWLVGAMEQYFYENKGLEIDEVEDFLVDILDAEFHTVADDGSPKEIAQKFCQFFVQEDMQRIPSSSVLNRLDCGGQQASPIASNCDNQQPPHSPPTLRLQNGVNKENDTEMEVDDVVDDGWRTISKERKRH